MEHRELSRLSQYYLGSEAGKKGRDLKTLAVHSWTSSSSAYGAAL